MSWNPLHTNHAIERIRVEIHLADPIPKKLLTTVADKFDSRRGDLNFGPRSVMASASVEISMSGSQVVPTQAKRTSGWLYQRESSPGTAVEAVILADQVFIYEVTEYLRWELQLKRIQSVIEVILEQVSAVTTCSRLVLDYVDRFIFEGAEAAASPATLMSPDLLLLLPEPARSGRELWHVHRGWYEGEGPTHLLMNQNCDAQAGKTQFGQDVRAVQIYTKAEKRDEVDLTVLDDLWSNLQLMHDRCNHAFGFVLAGPMRLKIGLVG